MYICTQAVPAAIPDANIFTCARHIIEFAPKVKGVKDVASSRKLYWDTVKSTTHAEFTRCKALLESKSPTLYAYCESRDWTTFVWCFQFQRCKTLGICTSNPIEQVNSSMKINHARTGMFLLFAHVPCIL